MRKKLKAIDSIPSLVVDVPFLSFPNEMNSSDERNQYKIVNKFTIMKFGFSHKYKQISKSI